MIPKHLLTILTPLGVRALPTSRASTGTLASITASGPPAVNHPTSLSHAPYSGTPTTTGAIMASSVLGSAVPSLGVAPGATDYPSNGKLQEPEPAPYVPAGGVGTNGTTPVYNAKSDFDFESLVRSPSLCPWTWSVDQWV